MIYHSKVIVLICVLLLSSSVTAQNATLDGLVVDEQDRALSGAAVTILNRETGLKRSTRTNKGGMFTFSILPPARYTMTVEFDGLETVEIRNVVLNVGDRKMIRIVLKVAKN